VRTGGVESDTPGVTLSGGSSDRLGGSTVTVTIEGVGSDTAEVTLSGGGPESLVGPTVTVTGDRGDSSGPLDKVRFPNETLNLLVELDGNGGYAVTVIGPLGPVGLAKPVALENGTGWLQVVSLRGAVTVTKLMLGVKFT